MFRFKNDCDNASGTTGCLKKMSVLRSTHPDRWQSTLAWLRATDGSRLTLPREELSQKKKPGVSCESACKCRTCKRQDVEKKHASEIFYGVFQRLMESWGGGGCLFIWKGE